MFTELKLSDMNDPALRSWVESANDPASDFPIQNLPLCVFEREHEGRSSGHLGVLIGDQILDINLLADAGMYDEVGIEDEDELDMLLEDLYSASWTALAMTGNVRLVRAVAQDFLRADRSGGQQARRLRTKALVPQHDAHFFRPVLNLNYTDFYASKHHARNVGSMFRPDNPLLPNYTHVPIGYHGRTSSLMLSGQNVRRPSGQTKADDAQAPSFGPCKMLDYEMELALLVAQPSEHGKPIAMHDARRHMLGMCILNDWSARDMQKWEYQPLGPFLAKNFATSLSPSIVTLDALEPFRIPGPEREHGDPQPLDYLRSEEDWAYDITVEVWLQSQQMRESSIAPAMISRGNFKHMYWTLAQMLVHHASNGCPMQPGDLLGSGTISGPEKSSRGCLLELTWDGVDATGKPKPRTPVQLPTGETRLFLADGDEVIMKAYAQREGYRRIGFGECRGRVQG